MAMNPTYRPSYDVWLNECIGFIEAVKIHGRSSTTGIDMASVRLANGLNSLVNPLIEMRLIEQEHNKRARTSYNSEYIERNIGLISNYLDENRAALKQVATSDLLQAAKAASLIEHLDCEGSSVGYSRMPNVLSLKEMAEHTASSLQRQLQRMQNDGIS